MSQNPEESPKPESSVPSETPVVSEESSAEEKDESVKALPKLSITDPAAERKLRRGEAKKTLAEARKLYKRGKKVLAPERQKEITTAIEALEAALADDAHSCVPAHENLKGIVEKRLKFARKSGFQELIESLLFALAFALVLRTFFVEPFKIPTRSMVPTLLEGDQLFVTKLSYGIRLPFYDDYIVRFSPPQRGDVIVFAFPNEEAMAHLARTNSHCMQMETLAEEKDYIKRIIGVEGDTIEVIDQVVHVNGEPISQKSFYERTVTEYFFQDSSRESWNTEKHGDAQYTTITHQVPNSQFGPIKVKPDHVFVMGDNRDNSADSRCWGQVPISNIKGRAQIIWWSSGHFAPRWNRMFTKIH